METCNFIKTSKYPTTMVVVEVMELVVKRRRSSSSNRNGINLIHRINRSSNGKLGALFFRVLHKFVGGCGPCLVL
jgi:hypothetical protein